MGLSDKHSSGGGFEHLQLLSDAFQRCFDRELNPGIVSAGPERPFGWIPMSIQERLPYDPVMRFACDDVREYDEEVIRVGSEMSDEVLLSYMKPVKEGEIARRVGRGPSDFFPRLAKLFIESDEGAQELLYKEMGRKWGAVAQGLRMALKNTETDDGVPLSNLAYVSVNKAEQTVYLRRRAFPLEPGEEKSGRGRPKRNPQ